MHQIKGFSAHTAIAKQFANTEEAKRLNDMISPEIWPYLLFLRGEEELQEVALPVKAETKPSPLIISQKPDAADASLEFLKSYRGKYVCFEADLYLSKEQRQRLEEYYKAWAVVYNYYLIDYRARGKFQKDPSTWTPQITLSELKRTDAYIWLNDIGAQILNGAAYTVCRSNRKSTIPLLDVDHNRTIVYYRQAQRSDGKLTIPRLGKVTLSQPFNQPGYQIVVVAIQRDGNRHKVTLYCRKKR